jgi:hypothetical protein
VKHIVLESKWLYHFTPGRLAFFYGISQCQDVGLTTKN